jgi:beta-glucanase (GH16 family)
MQIVSTLAALAGTLAVVAGVSLAGKPDENLWKDYTPNMPADAVQRANDDWPLSDQANAGAWSRYEPMSDEFAGDKLDDTKWWPKNPGWKGRQPAFFNPANVSVSDGKLHLVMRKEEPPDDLRADGYHTYSSAAVQSKGTVLYGYFEVLARAMRSHGSSAFWFYNSQPEEWTEIDMFEIGGGAPGFERKLHMTVHVMHTPTEKEHWSIGGIWNAPFDLADDYHVYGLDWTKETLRFYFDGVLVREGPNTHGHQPLTLNFDSETMPEWFGLPRDEDLPSTYSVDYVRAWKQGP